MNMDYGVKSIHTFNWYLQAYSLEIDCFDIDLRVFCVYAYILRVGVTRLLSIWPMLKVNMMSLKDFSILLT
jgi:hypothetical protein